MSAIILFDGVCNFCNSSVNFIIERDAGSYFKFAPLQSEIAQKLLNKYQINRVETDSVILIENDTAYTHSTAALRIVRKLNGAWSLLYALVVVPVFIRDYVYKLFAKNRYRFFGKTDACLMPTPAMRARFIN